MSFTWNYTINDFLFENFNIDKLSSKLTIINEFKKVLNKNIFSDSLKPAY